MGEPPPGFEPKRSDVVFGQVAVARHFVAPHHVRECVAELARSAKRKPNLTLGDVLVRRGYLTRTQKETIQRLAEKQLGPERIGRYELVAKIGEGGMGTVYKARDGSTGRTVALKILPDKLAQDRVFMGRFQREALAVTRLEHPNIVRGIDVGAADGSHYIAMEFIDGLDCDKMLARRGRIPEKEAVSIAMQVARALKYAHEKRLVHRDIKPANIIVTPDGSAKLTDLGLAKSTSATAAKLTQTGITMGTPHYISPEQAMGSRDLDIRSDIYSLGATLYHLVTGRVPFEGSSPAVIVAKHLTEELDNPRDLVPELSEGVGLVLEKMLTKDRDDRYPDPAPLIDDLGKVLEGKPPGSAALAPGLSAIVKSTDFRKAAGRLAGRRRERLAGPRRGTVTLAVGVLLGLGIAVGVAVLLVKSEPGMVDRIKDAAQEVAGRIAPENPERGWTPLFDGKSLAGWTTSGRRGWRVVEGFVEGTGRGSGLIETTRTARNYKLRAEVAASRGAVAWLILAKPRSASRGGYRVRLPARGEDRWIRIDATVRDQQVTVLADVEFLDPESAQPVEEGVIAFAARKGTLRFRNVRIRLAEVKKAE